MMAGDQSADFAQHAHAQKIDGEDFGAEPLQLVRALIGENDADQKSQQADNGKRADAGFLDLDRHGREAQILPWSRDHLAGLHGDAAQIAQHAPALTPRFDRGLADAIEPVAPGAHPRRGMAWLLFVVAVEIRQQAGIALRHFERADGAARIFEGPAGAQQKPGAGRIQLFHGAGIHGRDVAGPGTQIAQLLVQPGAFGDGPAPARLEHPLFDLEPGIRLCRVIDAGHQGNPG